MKYAAITNTVIRMRPETRKRLNKIADESGWKMVEAMDRAVKALEQSLRRRRAS